LKEADLWDVADGQILERRDLTRHLKGWIVGTEKKLGPFAHRPTYN
jgi:hypothetical protein